MHTLKGMAATLGVQPLAVFADEAEERLRHAEELGQHAALVAGMRAAVDATLSDIAHVAQALQEAIRKPEAAADTESAAPDLAGLRTSLNELTGLLRGADMRALEVYEHLQQRHAVHLKASLQPLDEAMASLDFEQALAHCQALTGGVTQ